MAKNSHHKVRLAAALSLSKRPEPRSLQALANALRSDRSTTIRRLAAVTLGHQLRHNSKRRPQKGDARLLRALHWAEKNDRNARVRSAAKVALKNAQPPADAVLAPVPKPVGILVSVSSPPPTTKSSKRSSQLLQRTVQRVIGTKSPRHVHTAHGTGMPSSIQLQQRGLRGYSVTPDVTRLTKRTGQGVINVQCEVRFHVTPWGPGDKEQWLAEHTATVTGKATVPSSPSKSDLAASAQSCILTVAEQVTQRRVIPFLASLDL